MKHSQRRGVASKLSSGMNLAALVAASVGLIFPMTQMSPERFVQHSTSLAAGAGSSLSAVVPSNPYNTLAQQLAEKEGALNAREDALNEKENAPVFSTGELLGFISFALSIILCILVGLNFYLDSRRGKKPGILANKFSVDLSNR